MAELRRQFGQDSSASSKPPSSDGLKKMPGLPSSRRGRSGKARGGQAGHEGGTLRQVADPDCVVHHKASACGHCGWLLDPKSAKDFEKRQVFDLAERPLLITEHQASIYRCEHCRDVNKAAFPDGLVSAAQYGERVKAAAVDQAFCNAHILRELNSLIEFDHEPWAELMRDMLLAASLAVDKARKAGARALAPNELAALVERYWAAVRLGLAFHRALPKLKTKASPRGRIKRRPDTICSNG